MGNLSTAQGVGITNCAYGKPPARQIFGIPLPGGIGHITQTDEMVRKRYLRTRESAHKMLNFD